MFSEYLKVGQIVNTFGINGDVKVYSHTDFPEKRFCPGSKLFLGKEEANEKLLIELESAKPYKQLFLVKFKGLQNINDVEKYKGYFLWIKKEQQEELPEGEFYYHEIIGCNVLTIDGLELGVVKEILTPGANDVWVVKQNQKGKDLLIPYIDQVVKNIDIAEKRIVIEIMEGLLDL